MSAELLAGTPGWWAAYTAYLVLLAGTSVERFVELGVSVRNARWAFAQGGVETGRGHFPPMVALHTALIAACALEPLLAARPFITALAVPMAVLALGSQALRWWCIRTLGRRWNTRIVVVPGLSLVRRGPYRVLPHPNYVAVVVEGVALPLIASGWSTALVFSLLNAVLLLGFRIPAEERALAAAAPAEEPVR
ncbi:isoprenylcysteine carboxyl methyltransferase family protein [Amnibacterium kyonggiense]|uniref:Alkylresorcinol O-methyltransferase n=1 Tax=Amnibacterium kyonggiense TaxID=595671 RepID=A0A4R7FTH6_9MICO|nr:isoprenylcysteine carboxylmethyltransferase family protein [Amnibacterium kyonggiense]TDS81019.1 alkylresorcinol O-methyltransferase [Amnibacterium kyonggiense]